MYTCTQNVYMYTCTQYVYMYTCTQNVYMYMYTWTQNVYICIRVHKMSICIRVHKMSICIRVHKMSTCNKEKLLLGLKLGAATYLQYIHICIHIIDCQVYTFIHMYIFDNLSFCLSLLLVDILKSQRSVTVGKYCIQRLLTFSQKSALQSLYRVV